MSADGVFSGDVAALAFGPTEQATAETMTEELNRLLAEARDGEDTGRRTSSAGCSGAARRRRRRRRDDDGARPRCRPAAGPTCRSSPAGRSVSPPSRAPSSGCSRIATGCAPPRPRPGEDVPTEVHRIADDLKVAYLQGLFSADAHRSGPRAARAGPEVTLASTAPELVRSVQLLLSDLGIASRIGLRPTPYGPTDAEAPPPRLRRGRPHASSRSSGRRCRPTSRPRADAILAHPFARGLGNPRATTVALDRPRRRRDGLRRDRAGHPLARRRGADRPQLQPGQPQPDEVRRRGRRVRRRAYRYAAKLTITAQEILVDNASYPTPRIEENSHRFRPLGLGYANLGALLMSRGLAYDSTGGPGLRRRPDRDHARRGVPPERGHRPRPRRPVQRVQEEREAVPAGHRQAPRRRLRDPEGRCPGRPARGVSSRL